MLVFWGDFKGERMNSLPKEIKSARYIKLGKHRDKETDTCLKDGEAFVHFGTSNPEVFALVKAGKWE